MIDHSQGDRLRVMVICFQTGRCHIATVMLCFDKRSHCVFVSVVEAAEAYIIRFGAKGEHGTSSSPNFACTVSGSVPNSKFFAVENV